jgi:hypothetical protein
MALPDLEELRSYLRLETEIEDELLEAALASAQAVTRQYLRVPLESEARTFQGRRPRTGWRGEPYEQLTVPVFPCDSSAVVTDVDGVTVDDATYTIDTRTGQFNAILTEAFSNPPYTVVIDVGLEFDAQYDDNVEPILRQAILYIAADIYFRRNSGAVYQQSGGQVSITYTEAEIPPTIKFLLESLRPRGRCY